MDKLLTTREAAQLLRVSEWTIRRWLRQGKLAGIWLSDAAGWRVPEAELERFVRERTRGREER